MFDVSMCIVKLVLSESKVRHGEMDPIHVIMPVERGWDSEHLVSDGELTYLSSTFPPLLAEFVQPPFVLRSVLLRIHRPLLVLCCVLFDVMPSVKGSAPDINGCYPADLTVRVLFYKFLECDVLTFVPRKPDGNTIPPDTTTSDARSLWISTPFSIIPFAISLAFVLSSYNLFA